MVKPLHIAMLAPIKRPLLADTTVSRLRIIVDLARGLLVRGHKITIFATADSQLTGVKIIGVAPKGINFLPPAENPFYQHTAYLAIMIKELERRQGQFDLIHNHMYPEFLPLLALPSFQIPLVTTVHAQATPELSRVLARFSGANLVAISKAAKLAVNLPMQVVYNGVDTDLFRPSEKRSQDYLLFVGRLSRAKDSSGSFLDPKGVQHAIAVAKKTRERLKIVGNVEDHRFYDQLIAPHLGSLIQFVGDVSSEQKLKRKQMVKLYQGAKALINPINWQEPFGLVMVEAMSCGIPVIAFNRGSVPEIVVDGETGYIVNVKCQMTNVKCEIKESGIDGLCQAVKLINSMARRKYLKMRHACRKRVLKHFSLEKMVKGYEKIYREVVNEK